MFASKFRADADRSPYGSFWFEPVTTRSISGARVSADRAMQLSAVYACVRVLSESFSVLPMVTYQTQSDGTRTEIKDYWLQKLLAQRPCDYLNPFAWRELLMGHLALRGNAFCQIKTNASGQITSLAPIHPDAVKIEMLDSGSWRYRIQQKNRADEVLTRDQMWHLRGLSGDGVVGMNPIELARDNIGEALDAQSFAARWYANDAKPSSGVITLPGKFATPEARATYRESIHAQHGGANRGKMMILEGAATYAALNVTQEDMQFIEGRQFKVGEIARLFRVPPHKIGDLSKATFSNIEQQALEFWSDTMHPWCERFEAAIEFDLMLDDEAEKYEVEFDMRGQMRGDTAARTLYYQGGIQNGWMTRNEARAAEGLAPIDGLEEPLRPANLVSNDEADIEPAAAEPVKPEPTKPAAARGKKK